MYRFKSLSRKKKECDYRSRCLERDYRIRHIELDNSARQIERDYSSRCIQRDSTFRNTESDDIVTSYYIYRIDDPSRIFQMYTYANTIVCSEATEHNWINKEVKN